MSTNWERFSSATRCVGFPNSIEHISTLIDEAERFLPQCSQINPEKAIWLEDIIDDGKRAIRGLTNAAQYLVRRVDV